MLPMTVMGKEMSNNDKVFTYHMKNCDMDVGTGAAILNAMISQKDRYTKVYVDNARLSMSKKLDAKYMSTYDMPEAARKSGDGIFISLAGVRSEMKEAVKEGNCFVFFFDGVKDEDEYADKLVYKIDKVLMHRAIKIILCIAVLAIIGVLVF